MNKERIEDVFENIRSELSYQEKMIQMKTHVRSDLTEGEYLLAIQKIVTESIVAWYSGTPPHETVRDNARKIAALCIRMCGDEHGMPKRK